MSTAYETLKEHMEVAIKTEEDAFGTDCMGKCLW